MLRWKMRICSAVLCVLAFSGTGCGVLRDVTHRVFIDQAHFNDPTDQMLAKTRNKAMATAAWIEHCKETDEHLSVHYGRGFKQGFVDYIDFGAVDPPVLPPRKYWTVFYATPDGHEAIDDWFTGYRFGVIAAEQTGYRQYVTIPVSVPKTLHKPEKGRPVPMAPDYNDGVHPNVPAPELLPPPVETWTPVTPTEHREPVAPREADDAENEASTPNAPTEGSPPDAQGPAGPLLILPKPDTAGPEPRSASPANRRAGWRAVQSQARRTDWSVASPTETPTTDVIYAGR